MRVRLAFAEPSLRGHRVTPKHTHRADCGPRAGSIDRALLCAVCIIVFAHALVCVCVYLIVYGDRRGGLCCDWMCVYCDYDFMFGICIVCH